MKNFLLTLIFTLSSAHMYSQEVNFGISLGTGLSNQTLQSSNSPYTAGQTWNTIGGLPYRVDPYLGYNAGLMIELFFDLNGRRGSGKGTTLEVLMAVAGGKEAYGIFRTSSLSNLNARFGLIGKKIAIDPDASGHISDAGVFNSITTNEPVEVEKKYVDRSKIKFLQTPQAFNLKKISRPL